MINYVRQGTEQFPKENEYSEVCGRLMPSYLTLIVV